MKNRGKHGKDLVEYLRYNYDKQFDELESIVSHMENYEKIIQRFINKRDALRFIVKSPYGYILKNTPNELEKHIIEYNLLEELLKGVY